MAKVALVTGSSAGIGYETALALAREGYKTYATMRNVSKGAKILEAAKKENLDVLVERLDVDEGQAGQAVSDIAEKEGRLDVLVNNAGYLLFGSAEEMALDDVRAQFETNFFGTIRTVQAAAPLMRAQGSGHIINISSVAGKIGFPGSSAYISSKFALEGLSESMRYELGQFGVQVVLIEPGVVKSGFMGATRVSGQSASSPYKPMLDKVISGIGMMAEMGTPPSKVADAVVAAAKEKRPLPRYIVGNDAAMFLEARRAKTDSEFEEYLGSELFGA